MSRAIDLLPSELKPFFEHYRADLIAHVTDPDLWRNVGWDDDPNHFIDFGVREYGPPPFTALPRDYSAAVEKFGVALVRRYGLLPWRETEQFGNLRREFEAFRGQAPYTVSNVMLFSAVSSHYAQDARQPFHATDNFDGQLTGQSGLHARFESDLIERYSARLRLQPAPARVIGNVRDDMFETLIESHRLVAFILQADKEAIAGRDHYDEAYFETFFSKVQPILEQRLSDSITGTASIIVSAWEGAGRPVLRMEDARPVQRVRPAR